MPVTHGALSELPCKCARSLVMPLSRSICALLLDRIHDLRRLICMANLTVDKAVMHTFEGQFAAYVSRTA